MERRNAPRTRSMRCWRATEYSATGSSSSSPAQPDRRPRDGDGHDRAAARDRCAPAVDDFGTGYSSLSRLLDLPLQELKIDRSFVMDSDGEGPGAAIVRSTIDLGHHLGLEVVAEGVETETTLAELRELGCDAVQGYHLLRPQLAADVTAWLRQREAHRTQPAPADIVIGDGKDPR